MLTSQWPIRTPQQATPVERIEYSDTHCFAFSADGVLSISIEELLLDELEEVPEFVQATKDRPGIALNKHNMQVLKRLLNELDI